MLPNRPDEKSILGVQAGEIPETGTVPRSTTRTTRCSADAGRRSPARRVPDGTRCRAGPTVPARPSDRALPGDLVQRDARGDAGVQRLDRRTRSGWRRSRRTARARAGTDPCPRSRRRARAGRSRSGSSPIGACRRRRRGPTTKHARLLEALQRAHEVRRARDGHAGRGAGGHLPRRRGDAGGTPLGHQHAVRPEGPGGAQHGAEVARVGHTVERDDQRRHGPTPRRRRAGRRRRRTRRAGPGWRRPGAPRRR